MAHFPDIVYYGLSFTNVYIYFVYDPSDDSGMFGPDEFIHTRMSYNDSLSVVTKGQQLEFTTGIRFMVNFDESGLW
jgi:hypothetical protein